MRAAIETGVGLTAAKLMVGKAVAKSDETYIAKARLDEAFKRLSKYLSVTGVEEDKKPLQETIVQQESEIVNLRNRLDVVVKAEGEMRDQLNALQSEVAELSSTLDMIPGGFGPRRPSKEAKKSVLAATKKLAKEYVAKK